jgi:phage terminase large subunit GpA-like protein
MVGVDQAKSLIMRRLKIDSPGPGYCHFPAGRSIEYFRQLTAEKLITRYVKGFPRREWKKQDKARNEALDCRVYALAALILRAPQFDKIAYRLKTRAAELREKPPAHEIPAQDPEPVKADSASKSKHRPTRRRGGFVNAWRH